MIKQISTKVLIFFHNHKQIKSNNVCISLGRLFTSIIYQLVRVCFLLHHLSASSVPCLSLVRLSFVLLCPSLDCPWLLRRLFLVLPSSIPCPSSF